MKKFILSAVIIIVFVAYALNQSMGGTVVPGNINNTVTSSSNTSGNTTTTQIPVKPKLIPVPTPKPVPTPAPAPTPTPTPVNNGKYRDGEYNGDSADAYYGNVQVQAVIRGGRITDVVFLDHPQDRSTSVRINNYAMPILKSEAIQAQSASVNTVSGASYTSAAFRQSLASALSQAVN